MALRCATRAALLLALAGCAATPAPPPPTKAPLAAPELAGQLGDARPWLANASALARRAGAGELSPVGVTAGQEGDRVGSFVTVRAGECLLALAEGASTVTDADVHVFSDGGDLIASDEARRAGAAVLVCPPLPERVYVSARIAAGSGVVAVGAALVPERAAPVVAKAVGARWQGASTDAEGDPWSAAARALEQRRAAIGPSWPELRRVLLPVEARARSLTSVPVGAGRCVDVLAMPGAAVQSLELTVETTDGRVAARAAPNGRERVALVCAHADNEATIALRAVGSSGLGLVVVRESPPGAWTEVEAPAWLDEPRATGTIAEATAKLGLRLRSAWNVPRRVGAANAPVGQALRFPIALEPGCSRIDVVGASPLVGLRAELWSGDGQRWAGRAGRPHAALFYCGDGAAAVAEVSAETRSGPFEVQLRRVSPVPELARRHGLGAARLLGRFEERGMALAAAELGRARLLELTARDRTVLPVTVPASGCVRVAAALVGEPTGLWLRLAGPAGDAGPAHEERAVVDAELCGTGAPAQGRIELASQGGTAQALLLAVEEAGRP